MNNVCCSTAEVLDVRHSDLVMRMDKNWAIYGTADKSQTILTQKGTGVKPVLSGGLIGESGPDKISTLQHGDDIEGYTYFINEDKINRGSVEIATKDDLILFISMAAPQILKNDKLEEAVSKRLAEVYQEELKTAGDKASEVKKQQEEEASKLKTIYDSVKKAVKGSGYEIYYSENYQPESQPE